MIDRVAKIVGWAICRKAGEAWYLAVRGPQGSRLLDPDQTLERLRRAIMELRPDEKEVFLLRQNGELTYDQIAEVRGSPVGTVKTQMRSAVQKLRRQFAL